MAEADLDRSIVPHVPIPSRRRPLWVNGIACVAILPLLGFIGLNGQELWGEFHSLQSEKVSLKDSEVVGYLEINPSPNFAGSPTDWLHDEPGATLLWAGWRDGEHRWFKLGRGEIDGGRISTPMGQDVIRAIDQPVYEQAGGNLWVRVPDSAMVARFDSNSGGFAYPIRVLDKVELVNDQIGEKPILVAYTPISNATSVFEAAVDGKRVTLGHSGYFFGNRPILYDRASESLWTERGDAMVAFAGRRKGESLKRIALLDLVPWSAWKADNPTGKLLVGADRSRPRPLD